MPFRFNPFTENLDWTDPGSHTQNTDTGTDKNDFAIGDGLDSDKIIIAKNADGNKPKLRYNSITNAWQYSNNGVDYFDFGGVTQSEALTWGTL